jgi:phosphate starvation-inducible protein PhoH
LSQLNSKLNNNYIFEIELDVEKEQPLFQGGLDRNLKVIEEILGVTTSYRGNKVFIQGNEKAVLKASRIIEDIRSISLSGYNINHDDLRYAIQSIASDEEYKSLNTCILKETFHCSQNRDSKKIY